MTPLAFHDVKRHKRWWHKPVDWDECFWETEKANGATMRTYRPYHKPWALLMSGMLVLAPLSPLAAGRGGGTFAGDGGPATEARLDNPRGVAVDQAGNLYIADSSNDRIRRVDRLTGIITTITGSGERGFTGDGGPAMSAQLYFPHGIALDEIGNLYIADVGNHRVRRVEARTGSISTVAGTGRNEFYGDGGPATAAGLYSPRGIALDKAGNLYIADSHHGCVRRVDREGLLTTVAGSNPRLPRRGMAAQYLLNPVGLTVGPDAQIYWADPTLNRVKKVDLSHTDPQTKNGWITNVAGNATMGFSGDGSLAREAELAAPAALAFDSRGPSLHCRPQ